MGPLLKRVHTAMLLRTLLPDEIYCSEQIGTLAGELFAEEASLLGPGSVEKRWREFAAGRSCARKALAASGHAPVAVLQGAGREPVWPQGIVGSITHCSTYCAAAVAGGTRFASLGIDAEPNEALPPGVLDRIATRRERAWLQALTGTGLPHWDRLLFSIKESIYKTWYPLERCWLGFEEAEVSIVPEACVFEARILHSSLICPPVIRGRFTFTADLLLSVAFIDLSQS